MFQLLKNPSFDFMSRRTVGLMLSAVAVVVSIGIISIKGINLGIEFTGGTEVLVKFSDEPDISGIRDVLRDAGLPGTSVTTLGQVSENEVAIRVAGGEQGSGEDVAAQIHRAIGVGLLHLDLEANDLNVEDSDTLAGLLGQGTGLGAREAQELADRILDRRRDVAIFRSFDELADVEGMQPAILDHLRENATIGPLANLGQSYIGPAIGKELMRKAMFAIGGSLLGMLIYIWIRFQIVWGLAAVVALAHDTIITLGLFSLFGKEMSLAVVAAFLTLIGYSVNDTVVVFDRIRENVKNRRADGLTATINLSINQTLSRTIITSGLTWIVVFGVMVFGGPALNAFAFVLTAGVVVGTYSSIYVASPVVLVWRRLLDRRKGAASSASATAA